MLRFTIAAAILSAAAAPGLAELPKLVPEPASLQPGTGAFAFGPGTVVGYDAPSKAAAAAFADLVRRTRGFSPRLASGSGGTIRFVQQPGMAAESYAVAVTPAGVTVTAGDAAGLYYGAVTLWQLATQDGEGKGATTIPAVTIRDAPRFGWRGVMLDSARHFQSVAFVKQFIEWMALNKLNRFHWHLVDDQGWRLQIRKYPRLTEVGAWRSPAVAPGAPPLPKVGGFYTQAEVRDVVAFAAARGITVVPEIEMPGHALAALRAYPELGTVPPPPGIESDWGVFPYLYNVDDRTFGFLEDVLTEVMELFPSSYIHVGGDEAVKDLWKTSPAIQAKIKQLGLKDEEALQGWFVARIGRFLESKGRRLIGWDEILMGGVPADATIMSWRGIDGAVTAAKAGHDTVLTPAPDLYINYRQGTTAMEPPGPGTLRTLADVYGFDPTPAAIPAEARSHILGLQANLWTEHLRTEDRIEWMAFPRAIAVAEIGWSPAAAHDFGGFVGRLAPQIARLHELGLDGATSAFTPSASAAADGDGQVSVTLANQIGAEMRYTTDGSAPGLSSARYTAPIAIAQGTRLRAASFLDGAMLPGPLERRFDAASLATRDSHELETCSNKYALDLDDDAPAHGERAHFVMDIVDPCWTWKGAPMDGVASIALEVGQLPFNFQVGKDRDAVHFRPPATPAGEMEIRDGCDGARIAVLPLGPAAGNPGVTRLSAPVTPLAGAHDLCITYTATGVNPLWAVKSIRLVGAKDR